MFLALPVIGQVEYSEGYLKYRLYASGDKEPYAEVVGYDDKLAKGVSHLRIPICVTVDEVDYKVSVICSRAFENWPDCVYITLPSELQYIGKDAFKGCNPIYGIYYNTDSPVEADSVGFEPDVYGRATLHIARGGLEKAEHTLPWSKFKDIRDSFPTIPCLTEDYQTYSLTFNLINSGNGSPYAEVHSYSIPDGIAKPDITIPSYVTRDSIVYPMKGIYAEAFQYCRANSISLPDSITSIGSDAFAHSGNIKELTIPNTVEYIGPRAFQWCDRLETITLPRGITVLPEECLANNRCLQNVIMPDSLTIIGRRAFAECHSLKYIDIPKTVTEINVQAFIGCQLWTITLPRTLKKLDYGAFWDTNMYKVVYNTEAPIEAQKGIFPKHTYTTGVLIVADGGLENARRTYPWSEFVHIKEVSGQGGLNDYSADDEPTEVYTIDGVKTSFDSCNPVPGIYIVRKGNHTQKVIVR